MCQASAAHYTGVLGADVYQGIPGALGPGAASTMVGFAQKTDADATRYVHLPLSKSYIAPLFFKMAQNLDLRCVLISDPGTLGAGAKTRLESRMKKFTPHCVCRYDTVKMELVELASQSHLDLNHAPYNLYVWC